jgi:hypothetical protein
MPAINLNNPYRPPATTSSASFETAEARNPAEAHSPTETQIMANNVRFCRFLANKLLEIAKWAGKEDLEVVQRAKDIYMCLGASSERMSDPSNVFKELLCQCGLLLDALKKEITPQDFIQAAFPDVKAWIIDAELESVVHRLWNAEDITGEIADTLLLGEALQVSSLHDAPRLCAFIEAFRNKTQEVITLALLKVLVELGGEVVRHPAKAGMAGSNPVENANDLGEQYIALRNSKEGKNKTSAELFRMLIAPMETAPSNELTRVMNLLMYNITQQLSDQLPRQVGGMLGAATGIPGISLAVQGVGALYDIAVHGQFQQAASSMLTGLTLTAAPEMIRQAVAQLPDANPLRAILSVIGEAAQTEAALTEAQPALVLAAGLVSMLALSQSGVWQGRPASPESTWGNLLTELPEIATRIHQFFSLFANLPGRASQGLAALYSSPTSLPGILPGSTVLPPLQPVAEELRISGEQLDGDGYKRSQIVSNPEGTTAEVQAQYYNGTETRQKTVSSGEAGYQQAQSAQHQIWQGATAAGNPLMNAVNRRGVTPAVSGFLSQELGKLNGRYEAYRGVHCEVLPVTFSKPNERIIASEDGSQEASLWRVRFTGYVSAGEGESVQVQQWRTELGPQEKAQLDALLAGGTLPPEESGGNHVLNQVGKFLAGEQGPAEDARLADASVVSPVEDEAGGWAETLLVQLQKADKAFGQIMGIFPTASANVDAPLLPVYNPLNVPIEQNPQYLRNTLLLGAGTTVLAMGTYGGYKISEWLGFGQTVDASDVNIEQPEMHVRSSAEELLILSSHEVDFGADGMLQVRSTAQAIHDAMAQYPGDLDNPALHQQVAEILKHDGIVLALAERLDIPLNEAPNRFKRHLLTASFSATSGQSVQRLEGNERQVAASVINMLATKEEGDEEQDASLYNAGLIKVIEQKGGFDIPDDREQAWLTLYQNYQSALTEWHSQLSGDNTDSSLSHEARKRVIRAHFDLAALEADINVKITGGRDAYIKGLDILKAAKNNDPKVQMSTLSFKASGGAIGSADWGLEVAIPNMLVMEKAATRDALGGVVLYDSEGAWSYFPNSATMYQYINLNRLEQHQLNTNDNGEDALRQSVIKAATSGERMQLMRYFAAIERRPDLKAPDTLKTEPLAGANFEEKFGLFADKALAPRAVGRQATKLVEEAGQAKKDLAELLSTGLVSYEDRLRNKTSADFATLFRDKGINLGTIAFDANDIELTINDVSGTAVEWVDNQYRNRENMHAAALSDNPFLSTNHLPGRIIHKIENVALSFWRQFTTENNHLAPGAVKFTKVPDGLIPGKTADETMRELNNNPELVQSVIEYFRRTYTGDQYRQYLTEKHLPADSDFNKAWVKAETLNLKLAVKEVKNTRYILSSDATRMVSLVEGKKDPRYPQDKLGTLNLSFGSSKVRVPGFYTFELQGKPQDSGKFVYVPDAPYGQQIFKMTNFREILKNDFGKVWDIVEKRTLQKDSSLIELIRNGANGNRFVITSDPVSSLPAVAQTTIQDYISDVEQVTTSRWEVFKELLMKTTGYIAAVTCMGTGGLFVAACGTSASLLYANGVSEVINDLESGNSDEALLKALLLPLDAGDMLPAVGMVLKLGGRSAKALSHMVGKTIKTADEAQDALNTVLSWNKSIRKNGDLNPDVAVNYVDLSGASREKPGLNLAGEFWQKGGKTWTKSGDHTYEIYSDNGWQSVRLRDPSRPNAQGPMIKFEDGKWQLDQAELAGGGKPVQELTGVEKARLIELQKKGKKAIPPEKKELQKLEKQQQQWEKEQKLQERKNTAAGKVGKTPAELLADKQSMVLAKHPEEAKLITDNNLAISPESAQKTNAYYIKQGFTPQRDPEMLKYETATEWYRAMTKEEFNNLSATGKFSQQDTKGYGGITPSYDYSYDYFSPNDAAQTYLVRFKVTENVQPAPLSRYFSGKISQPKVEDGAISIGLGGQGTPVLPGVKEKTGEIFNHELESGNISFELIGLNIVP